MEVDPVAADADRVRELFRGELAGFARDVLLSDRCRERGVFNPAYLERLLSLNDRGRDLDLQLWTVLSFELWCRRFIDGRVADTAPARSPRNASQPVVVGA